MTFSPFQPSYFAIDICLTTRASASFQTLTTIFSFKFDPKTALLAAQIQLPTEGNRYGDWYSKVVQRNQGLRLYSAGRRFAGRIRSHLGC
ncbi:protein of unknown function [Agrobacterium pusense]|uniref:Uncharacterized protein n=1 Tax=Agrobacterium pusense TaxID=648995 RepID=U4Q3E5_9HYPH|nr:protein of unknown function [Agrobacterium pusense]